jgi:hypothetical protein
MQRTSKRTFTSSIEQTLAVLRERQAALRRLILRLESRSPIQTRQPLQMRLKRSKFGTSEAFDVTRPKAW